MKYISSTQPVPGTSLSLLQLEHWLMRDSILIALLLVLAIATRWPFRSEILYHWDSVNFAYAIVEFDVAKEQPHPPGYIGYVWLSRLVNSLTHDAPSALVLISIVTSTLAVISLYYLGRSIFDRFTGLIAALFLATSPLFWFYSEIALPHTLDTFLVIVSGWCLYETMKGNTRYLYPAIIVLAIAGGVRQQTLVFLAPLVLFALRGVGWKRFIIAGVLGVGVCLLWFIPLITLNGGLANYMRIMNAFGARFQDTTSIFMGAGLPGLTRNLLKLTLYTLYGWSLALLPAIAYSALRLYQRRWPQQWERFLFLLLWITPSLLFYALIHMGQQGLIFIFLPVLLLVSSYSLKQLFTARPYVLAGATTALIMINLAIFCLLPEYPLGANTQRFLTWDTLVNSDRYFEERFKTIQSNFKPENTLILAANSHHVEYYLPQYQKLAFNIGSKWEHDQGQPINDAQRAYEGDPAELGLQLGQDGKAIIVIFDPSLNAFNRTPEMIKKIPLSNDDSLEYLELPGDSNFSIAQDSFGLMSE